LFSISPINCIVIPKCSKEEISEGFILIVTSIFSLFENIKISSFDICSNNFNLPFIGERVIVTSGNFGINGRKSYILLYVLLYKHFFIFFLNIIFYLNI
jgi:hypothetical protein